MSGYNPMHKQGAIILGIGGDNSKGSAGTFYEGVMTSGYPLSHHRKRRPGQHRRRRLRTTSTSGGGATGTIVSGLNSSKCVDNNNGSGTNGNKVQIWTCDGNTAAQNWTVNSNGTLTIDGGCMDITNANYSNGTLIEWWTCNGGANQQWQASERGAGQPGLRQVPRRSRLQHHQRDAVDLVHLQRRQQPALDAALTVP